MSWMSSSSCVAMAGSLPLSRSSRAQRMKLSRIDPHVLPARAPRARGRRPCTGGRGRRGAPPPSRRPRSGAEPPGARCPRCRGVFRSSWKISRVSWPWLRALHVDAHEAARPPSPRRGSAPTFSRQRSVEISRPMEDSLIEMFRSMPVGDEPQELLGRVGRRAAPPRASRTSSPSWSKVALMPFAWSRSPARDRVLRPLAGDEAPREDGEGVHRFLPRPRAGAS